MITFGFCASCCCCASSSVQRKKTTQISSAWDEKRHIKLSWWRHRQCFDREQPLLNVSDWKIDNSKTSVHRRYCDAFTQFFSDKGAPYQSIVFQDEDIKKLSASSFTTAVYFHLLCLYVWALALLSGVHTLSIQVATTNKRFWARIDLQKPANWIVIIILIESCGSVL